MGTDGVHLRVGAHADCCIDDGLRANTVDALRDA